MEVLESEDMDVERSWEVESVSRVGLKVVAIDPLEAIVTSWGV